MKISDADLQDREKAARVYNAVLMRCTVCECETMRPPSNDGAVHLVCIDRPFPRSRGGVWRIV